jgi:hypothetical protein
MLHSTTKTELYSFANNPNIYEKLKYYAYSKLLTYKIHKAGKGSVYIYVGELKIRFADHENTSIHHDEPDFNIVRRGLTEEELKEIVEKLEYPELSKQKAFALHVRLTIPKLKKLLPADCFEQVILDEYYFNTYTTMIKVKESLAILESMGINDRLPVRQQTNSYEDYAGGFN